MNRLTKALANSEKILTEEKNIISQLRKIISKNIKIRRLAKGMTTRATAKALGISAAYYSDLENGRRNISAALAAKADTLFL